MSKESIINEMEKIIKERKEAENASDRNIPEEFVKMIHVDATSFDNTSVTTQLGKAMNGAIFEEPMYSVKSITNIYSDGLSATAAILFKRKF